MIHALRLLMAMTLFHPLEGVTFVDWLRLLRRERFRVNPIYWPRALWITGMSLANSVGAQWVERWFGAAIEATRVEAPIFILGHYRSGTTHLHELLATDPRFASPNRFQTFNPRTFLGTERWLAPVVEPFMLPRRVQEDEVAYMVLSQLSPYLDWCFPRSRSGYRHTLTFVDADPAEVAAWSAAMVWFLKALTLKLGRPLILKSPPHTARVRLLLELFPDARFVHIRRDPYAVFVSTVGLLRALGPVFRFQLGPREIDTGAVLRTYRAMYDSYFADCERIPPGRLVEIAYEDLDRDPIGQVRAIYDGLSMGDFERVRPAYEAYLAKVAGYQKNRHPKLDDASRASVAEACSRCFEAWGYPR
jgi:omega-hydroxy-beta-dihydromenaquinone-9 sulfotransferase